MPIQLVEPSYKYEKIFKDLTDVYKIAEDFCAYCDRLRGYEKGINLPKGWAPFHTYWLIEGDQHLLGLARIQLKLDTPLLRNFIGNIGFEIRQPYRNKGYGKIILREALKRSKALGLNEVLLVCSANNKASQKIIMYNGGQFEDALYDHVTKSYMKRYWIDTDNIFNLTKLKT